MENETQKRNIFICHKCNGNLGKHEPELRGCGCISGWVRDWQLPITLDEAKQAQATGEYPKTGQNWG